MTHSVIHRTEMFDAHLDLGGQPVELSEYATTGLVALAVAPRGQGKTNAGILIGEQLAAQGWVSVFIDAEDELESMYGDALAGLVDGRRSDGIGASAFSPRLARTALAWRKLSPPLWAMAASPGARACRPAKSLTCALRMLVSRLPSRSQAAYTSHRPRPRASSQSQRAAYWSRPGSGCCGHSAARMRQKWFCGWP